MCAFCYLQGGYPPIIIPVQERYTYYEKLSLADEGDVRPFIRYIANLTDRTIDEYLQFTQKQINEAAAAVSPSVPDQPTVSTPEPDQSKDTTAPPTAAP